MAKVWVRLCAGTSLCWLGVALITAFLWFQAFNDP